MDPLLTIKDAAKFLKCSEWYVYHHSRELGGFYLPGSKLLRFRREKICECLEGKDGNVDVSIQVSRKETRKKRIQDQKRSTTSARRTQKGIEKGSQRRYQLIGWDEMLSRGNGKANSQANL
jgi:hypothetical protein